MSSIASCSEAKWQVLAEYKKYFPIWGPMIEDIKSKESFRNLVEQDISDLNLTFKSGQISYYIRKVLSGS